MATTITAFNTERTFGVEIEFFNATPQAVIAEMERRGIAVKFEGYNHTTRRHWKIVTDVSVTGVGTGVGRGLEIVSPPLKGWEGIEELRQILEGLETVGARVDKSCGLHIHHDAKDFVGKDFANLYVMYYKFEKFFDAMVPVSRRGNTNHYCKSISREQIEVLAKATTIADVQAVFPDPSFDRYYKLNFCSFFRHGTVEFRQHGGTIDFDKISNWIILTQAIVERAKGSKVPLKHDREETDVEKHQRRFRRCIMGDQRKGYFETEVGKAMKFAIERRKHFAMREAQ